MAQSRERSSLETRARFENGVVVGEDEARSAQLGKLHELPSLGDVLAAWLEQIRLDECEDYAVDFRELLLAPDGRMDLGFGDKGLIEKHGTQDQSDERLLPMTYRTFGNVVRHYCSPPRNSARNLVELPRAQDPHAHSGRTMRQQTRAGEMADSPRAIAYNAWLDKKKRADQTVTSLTGEPATTVLFRSRRIQRRDENGVPASSPRVLIGVVTPTHCLRDGDDDKLIAAITLAFAGSVDGARGSAYRGIEESELRAVFPALTVSMPDAGTEKWSGYVTARNSESGAKSWSVSAGLYRSVDGASVACEAIVRTGRHVGSHVAERMCEVAEGAAVLLKELAEKASALAAVKWTGTEAALLKQLRASLQGTVLFDADTCCGLAFDLGMTLSPRDYLRGVDPICPPVTVGALIDVLGRAAGACTCRVDARPVEVMLGRMLLSGWGEFKSAGTEIVDDGAGEE